MLRWRTCSKIELHANLRQQYRSDHTLFNRLWWQLGQGKAFGLYFTRADEKILGEPHTMNLGIAMQSQFIGLSFDLGFDRFFSGHNISVHDIGQHSGKSEAQNLILQSDTVCHF
jgi:hypothetical protein